MPQILIHLLGWIITWGVWLWLIYRPASPLASAAVAVLGTLAVIPFVLLGRRLLDRQPDVEHARRLTTLIHYLLAVLLGSALIEATRFGLSTPSWQAPLPPWIGLALMAAGGVLLLLVVFNLVLKGSGSPFAIALTREVVTDWLYAWTRNPMILSALAFLVGLGLWMGSGLFLVWLLVVASPVITMYLSVYEERELEIRFGPAYLDYKNRTPRFIPRPPRA